MSNTLNELVRKQILAEGPDIASERDWDNQHKYGDACEAYVDETLDRVTRAELLERISDALDSIMREPPTRLGI
jgi:uncharacterized protein YpiB (UPF0302 family)